MIASKHDASLTVAVFVSLEPSINFSQILRCEPDTVPHSRMCQYLLEGWWEKQNELSNSEPGDHSPKTDMYLVELQLSVLVDIQQAEDLLWAEVELLSQLFLTILHHQLALHQTF